MVPGTEFRGPIAKLAAGGFHIVICTTEGKLYTLGQGWRGQLGHGVGCQDIHEINTGQYDEEVPRFVEALSGRKVISAATGLETTAVCTEAGEVYTFGAGKRGKLGHEGEADEHSPRLVSALIGEQVIDVDVGFGYSVMRTAEGKVFSFGKASESGDGDGKIAQIALGYIESLPAWQRRPQESASLIDTLVKVHGEDSSEHVKLHDMYVTTFS